MNETTHMSPQSFTLSELVRKVLAAADAPLTFADVKKSLKTAGVQLTGKKKVSDPEIQRELEGPGIYVHPAPTARGKPKYWHAPPLTVAERIAETVRAKVAALADEPVKPTKANFGKPSPSDGAEASTAFDEILKRLLAEGAIFAHAGGKYGKKPPPRVKWHEAAPHKSEFTKIVNAAKKVLALGGVSADELFGSLREQLGLHHERIAHTEQKPQVPATVAPPPIAPTDLRAVLKQAYEHLCQFVEFRDRLVELPRLYHEALKRMPGLTVEAFQSGLWQMNEERQIELHVINEVSSAKEPQLAIHRNDRLYYFARWK